MAAETRPGGTGVQPGDVVPAGAPGTREAVCPDCQGKGRIDGRRCPSCEGSGIVVRRGGDG